MSKTIRSLLLAAAVLPLAAACADVRTPTASEAAAPSAPLANHNNTTACTASAQAPTVVTVNGVRKVRTVYQVGCTAGVYRIFVQGTLRTSIVTQNGLVRSQTCQSATAGGTVGGCTVIIDVDAPGTRTIYYGDADGAVRFHATDASAVTLPRRQSAIRYCNTSGCTT